MSNQNTRKRQNAIINKLPTRIMTPAEWEYATDDYKEHRKIIDKSISGKENVDKTSESTLTNDQIKEFKEEQQNAEDSYGFRSLADNIVEADDKE